MNKLHAELAIERNLISQARPCVQPFLILLPIIVIAATE